MKKVLVTGAGTGFGHEAAMRLAEKGFDVIASVEIWAQKQTVERDAKARGVKLQVEKLDVTVAGDRKKALDWGIEILVNNAGVLEGGAIVDIPADNMRHEFEVNVIGPILLTQGIAKQMVKRGKGRIVWVSSREGLNVNPFTGIYSASKHAIEAVAETMKMELQEFGVEVATVNPGPFLTGFNDRGFETWKSWKMNLPNDYLIIPSSPFQEHSSILNRSTPLSLPLLRERLSLIATSNPSQCWTRPSN